MADTKFLDENGLRQLWNNISNKIDSLTKEKVRVQLSKSDGGTVNTTVYLKTSSGQTSYSYNGNPITIMVDDGETYTISFAKITNYLAPASQTRVATAGSSTTFTLEYKKVITGVSIMDTSGNLHAVSSWKGGSNATGVALITDNVQIVVAPHEWTAYASSDSPDYPWNGNRFSAWGNALVPNCTTATTESGAIVDYNGSTNTDAIITHLANKPASTTNISIYMGAPAAEYCRAYSRGCKGVGEWYLPSAGEYNEMKNNRSQLQTALAAIGQSSYDSFFYAGYAHTSTQYNSIYSWCYWDAGQDFTYDQKDYPCKARPICKLTSETGQIISFAIGSWAVGSKYIAVRGMTWKEWLSSTYNSTGVKLSDIKGVKESDVIVGGTIYEKNQFITIRLNSQWQASSETNPDSTKYNIYESFSNKGLASTAAIMYIDIDGYTDFTVYIRSYAELGYDYVMISQLDQELTNNTSYSNTTYVKAHTNSSSQSGTTLSNYTEVNYSGIDGGKHTICVCYRKDGSANSGNDKGYILVPKS